MTGSGRGRLVRVFAAAYLASLLALVGGLTARPAMADVQKVLFVCVHGRVKQICPQFRASLRVPDGWVEDKIAESKQGRVVYVPKTKTYETAPAVITALTLANKAKTSVETLAQRYQDAFKQANKDVTIAPLAPIANEKIGSPVKLFKVIAPDTKPRGFMIQGWFADKDADGALFSIELTLSALNERALAEARPKLDAMLKAY